MAHQVLLHRKEAADQLRMSLRTLDKFVNKGLIPWIDLGHGCFRHKRGFDRRDLDAFKESRKQRKVEED